MDNKYIIDLIGQRAEILARLKTDIAAYQASDPTKSQGFQTVAAETGKDILDLTRYLGLHDLSATIKTIRPSLCAVSRPEAATAIKVLRKQNRLLKRLMMRVRDIKFKKVCHAGAQHLGGSTYPAAINSAKDAAIRMINKERTWFTNCAMNGGKDDPRMHDIAKTLELGWLRAALKTDGCIILAKDATTTNPAEG